MLFLKIHDLIFRQFGYFFYKINGESLLQHISGYFKFSFKFALKFTFKPTILPFPA